MGARTKQQGHAHESHNQALRGTQLGVEPDDLTPTERDVAARVGELHDVDFAAMAAIANVYRVASAVRNHMEREVLGPDQLSWTAFTALYVLWIWGDQESRRLAEECSVSKGTLTGVVTTLESRGLVARKSSPTDGRLVVIGLTAKGRSSIKRLFPKFNDHEALVTSRLDDSQRRSLAHLLREVVRSVDELEADSARDE
jgi:MarR family transcriptional regulator, organic hydroperoxide resistance regulator